MYDHVANARRGQSDKLYIYMRSKLSEGYEVEYTKINAIDKISAIDLEKKLIKYYGRKGIDKNGILMNISLGGNGGRGSTTKLIKEKSKKPRIYNDSFKAKDWHTSEECAVMLAEQNEHKKIKIIQMDLDNNVIKEWNSMFEASQYLGINAGTISNVCLGKCKTGGGYKWKKI